VHRWASSKTREAKRFQNQVATKKSPHILFMSAAAIWLRALLWTQMKSILFFFMISLRAIRCCENGYRLTTAFT